MDKWDRKHQADDKDFYLKEYEALRKEIEWLLEDYRSLERNVVIAIGVTWGWLFKEDAPRWAWFVPCLFAVLGAIRAAGIMKRFGVFREYIGRLEDAFSSQDDPGGWEHFSRGKTWTFESAIFFWAILILVTIGVGVHAYFPNCPM